MKLPPIDFYSFVIGFVLALILVLVISRVIKLIPQIKQARLSRLNKVQLSNIGENERLYRSFLLRRCQQSHLAAPLFPLDDIYVDLKLIGHPFFSDPEYNIETDPLVFQYFPISFGDPAGFTELPAPLITLEQALSGGRNIAVTGEIGSGKTSLLAHFTSQILEGKSETEELRNSIPIFLHINDFELNVEKVPELFETIATILHEKNHKLLINHLSSIFQKANDNAQLVLIIDGFDELRRNDFDLSQVFIANLVKKYPAIKVIVSCGQNYFGELEKIGFACLPLQVPGSTQKTELLRRWSEAWNRLASELGLEPFHQISPFWTTQNKDTGSMFNLTNALWTDLAMDHKPGSGNHIDDFLNRFTSSILTPDSLIRIAEQIKRHNSIGLTRNEIVEFFRRDSLANIILKNNSSRDEVKDHDLNQILSVTDILDLFVDLHFFVERQEGLITFSHPAILSYLLSKSTEIIVNERWKELLSSPMDEMILAYSLRNKEFLSNWIADEDYLLHRNLILTNYHLDKNIKAFEYFPKLAKKVLPIVMQESLPSSIRFKLFNIFERDTQGYIQLLDHLRRHSSPFLRQIAALGYGKVTGINEVQRLLAMLSDPDVRVQMASCLSLYSIFNEECIDALSNVMMNGVDDLRRFVAELLAFKSGKGHILLKDLSETGNIKCKKAVVSGLRLVSEPWATELLQKISTSDNQWLIRDAAAHALETNWNLSHYIPTRRTTPSESSWIIKLASQDGYSIPADVYPYDLLYHSLNTGVLEERVTSLGYITEKPDEKTNQKLIELMGFENPLREEAFFQYEKLQKKLSH